MDFSEKSNKNDNAYFIENQIDIGTISKSDGASKATFVLKNSGNEPIVLTNVVPDCHCISSVWEKVEILPNGDYEIVLEYDNSSFGFFEQTAKIFFENDKPELLIFQGTIKP